MNESRYFKNRLKILIERLTFWIFSVWSCIPIIAGIIIPMVVMFPLAYASWIIFSFWSGSDWLDVWFTVSINHPIRILFVIIIEIFIFVAGFFLFTSGLYHLVKGKRDGIDIIQTGPYKFIRHPQNLGILLIALPFALYIPGFNDLGIRIGEILSWTLFGFFLIIYSYFEEYKLNKKYLEEFRNYQIHTGFFIPKLNLQKKNTQIECKIINYQKKYLFLILGYILLIFIIFFLTTEFLMRLGLFTVFL